MSHEGKISRGQKWDSFRDREGKLPDEISKDPNKMVDVDYFLESKKKPVEEKPKSKEKK